MISVQVPFKGFVIIISTNSMCIVFCTADWKKSTSDPGADILETIRTSTIVISKSSSATKGYTQFKNFIWNDQDYYNIMMLFRNCIAY